MIFSTVEWKSCGTSEKHWVKATTLESTYLAQAILHRFHVTGESPYSSCHSFIPFMPLVRRVSIAFMSAFICQFPRRSHQTSDAPTDNCVLLFELLAIQGSKYPRHMTGQAGCVHAAKVMSTAKHRCMTALVSRT